MPDASGRPQIPTTRDINYARSRKGEIPHMTGVSSPYEAPEAPEIRVGTVGREVADIVAEVVGALKERGIVAGEG